MRDDEACRLAAGNTKYYVFRSFSLDELESRSSASQDHLLSYLPAPFWSVPSEGRTSLNRR